MNFEVYFEFPNWPFENPNWQSVFKMAAILHLEVGVCPKEMINSADLNDIGVL